MLAVMLTPGKTNPALDILLDVLPTTVHQEQALQQDMMLEKRFLRINTIIALAAR